MEFMRWREIGSLEQALAIVSSARQANAGVLVDALHLYRSGGSAQALAAAGPAWLHAAQLCDAPLAAPPEAGIIAEAREGRLPPGQGGLPLIELLQVLAPATALSVEMPMPKMAAAQRLALACASAKELLRRV
jgi:sugar phosphate isomerase/epimerase